MPPLQSDAKTLFDLIGFIASIASLVLAVLAIWLSVVLYRMSAAASRVTEEAAKDIAASVEKLEKLFEKLYADTFSIMKDTVTDMRKHIWPSDSPSQESVIDEVESRVDAKTSQLRSQLEQQVVELLSRQRVADDKLSSLTSELQALVNKAVDTSRQLDAEAREETVREHILRTVRTFRQLRPKVSVNDVVEKLQTTIPFRTVLAELSRMQEDGLVELSGEATDPNSLVRPVKEAG